MATIERHALDRTVMMLDRLRGIFSSDAEIARASGVDPAQLSRWRRGQEPSEPAWDRLVDLFAVVQKLEGVYTPGRIRAWLEGTNAHLGHRSPLYLIRHGETGEVISAIHALKAGAFA
jgi:transcriptional regulator with XRE-family HTH domain